MEHVSRRAPAAVLAVLMTVAVSGCYAFHNPTIVRAPTHAEIVGFYVHPTTAAAKPTLQLDDGGLFTLTDVPRNVVNPLIDDFEGDPDWTDLDTITGTWTVDDGALTMTVSPSQPGAAVSSRLNWGYRDSAYYLFFYLGDPDELKEFAYVTGQEG